MLNPGWVDSDTCRQDAVNRLLRGSRFSTFPVRVKLKWLQHLAPAPNDGDRFARQRTVDSNEWVRAFKGGKKEVSLRGAVCFQKKTSKFLDDDSWPTRSSRRGMAVEG